MKPLVIGHRGAAALEPENTLRSLRKGVECGADLVEVGVRLSKDEHLVVIHDKTVVRTTNGKGVVADLSLEDLKNLGAGLGEGIPTLGEVLDFIKETGRGIVVEIKDPGIEDKVVSSILASGIQSIFIVSFSAQAVKKVKEIFPGARAGLIFSRPLKNPLGLAKSINSDIILPKQNLLDQRLVESAHRHNILVFPWTLNSGEEIRQALDLGVDGFATDNPCLTREVLKSL